MIWTRREFVVRTTGGLAVAAWASNVFSWPQPLKVGIIGLGSRGASHLSVGLLEGVQVAAICDTNAGTLAQAFRSCEEWTGSKVSCTPDHKQLLEDESIEVVVVALPQHRQHEVLHSALRHRKHIVSVHPWAANEEESQRLVAAANEQSRLVWLAPYDQSWPFEAVEAFLAQASRGEERELVVGWKGTQQSHTTTVPTAQWTDLLASLSRRGETSLRNAVALQVTGPAGLHQEVNLSAPDSDIPSTRLVANTVAGAGRSQEWHLTLRSRFANREMWLTALDAGDGRPSRAAVASWPRFLTQLQRHPSDWRQANQRTHHEFVWNDAASRAIVAARA